MKSCSAAPMNLVGVDEATRGTFARQGRQGGADVQPRVVLLPGLGRPRMVLYLKGGGKLCDAACGHAWY